MTDIKELGLGDRARNALRRAGVNTAEQLLDMTPGEVLGLRGIGKVLYDEITDRLQAWYRTENKKTPGR